MNQKIFLAPLVCLLLTAVFNPPAQAGKTYRAERFDVQLNLLSGGDMLVAETVVFRFESGPFTYAFREVSASGTDGLTFLEASMDGLALPQGTGEGQVEIQSSASALKVTWHFAPTSDSIHEFVVRYRVTGVVSTGEADTLHWYVIPPNHGYPIDRATIWLNYPAGVEPLEVPTLDRTFESAPTDGGVRLTTAGIADDESVILTAKFPANSLVTATPVWQARQQVASAESARALSVGLFSGLATLLLGGIGLFAYARANRRELNLPEAAPSPIPPDDRVPPAVVGKLVGYETYSALGALFDLAQRGVLQVREEKGWFGAKKFIVERKNTGVSLPPHEQGMLQALFAPGKNEVEMNEIATRLASKKNDFYDPLEQELAQRGWFDPARKRKRTALMVIGLLAMFLGLMLFIGAGMATGAFLAANNPLAWLAAALAGLSGGLFALSIPLMIYAGTYSPLTPAGEEQKVRWKNFRAYLQQVSRGREAAIRPDTFERYLAFAAAFGLGEAWAKTFQKLGGVPLPAWFQALAGSDGDFGAMVAVMSSADTSVSAGGADGGGGASGGGSSGAG
jgi:uncharacterized protein (TIGR04222 family)